MTAPAFLPFALPEIGDEEIAEVVDTLRSGWVTTGPKARRFENDFAAFLGDPSLQAIAVNSATAGLHLALEALGIGPGDEVITTTHTFTATAVDKDAILAMARRHGLKVVEDAAHALPTTCGGALVGTLASDATVFSFYANKTITTGEGGMVVTRDPELAKRVKVMRLHGISRDAFDRFTAQAPSWHYEIVAPGYKYNLTDIAAALGIHQLNRARGFQQRRAAIAQRYRAAFADLPVQLPPEPAPGDLHAWHLYVLRLADDAPLARDRFIEQLFALGIGVSVHYIPLHLHPYWRERYRLDAAQFPHSQHAYERMLSLPLYTKMSEADVERVIAAVRQLLLRG
jgi:dTDP-4-amino-4,6-dideoxygalactose transaminase